MIKEFKDLYENDIEYHTQFNNKITNVPIEQIYKTQIYEIYNIFKDIGLENIKLIKYSPNMLTFNVAVNMSVFNTTIHEYGISKHANIIAKNKLVIKNILKDTLRQFQIIDNNMNIDILELSDYMSWK